MDATLYNALCVWVACLLFFFLEKFASQFKKSYIIYAYLSYLGYDNFQLGTNPTTYKLHNLMQHLDKLVYLQFKCSQCGKIREGR